MDDDEKKIDDSAYWSPAVDMPTGETVSVQYMEENQCPRCSGGIPNDMNRGEYPGALSRWDNMTEICSECGTQEAMLQFAGGEYRYSDPKAALDADHDNWYSEIIKAIIEATTPEEAQIALVRIIKSN